MAAFQIRIVDDGPLDVTAEFAMTDDRAATFLRRRRVLLCRCGCSARTRAFCDAPYQEARFASCPRASASSDEYPATDTRTTIRENRSRVMDTSPRHVTGTVEQIDADARVERESGEAPSRQSP